MVEAEFQELECRKKKEKANPVYKFRSIGERRWRGGKRRVALSLVVSQGWHGVACRDGLWAEKGSDQSHRDDGGVGTRGWLCRSLYLEDGMALLAVTGSGLKKRQMEVMRDNDVDGKLTEAQIMELVLGKKRGFVPGLGVLRSQSLLGLMKMEPLICKQGLRRLKEDLKKQKEGFKKQKKG